MPVQGGGVLAARRHACAGRRTSGERSFLRPLAASPPSRAASPASPAVPSAAPPRQASPREDKRARRPSLADTPPASFEVLSGAARLLVGTDGSLSLFRGGEAAPLVRGAALVPWFVARTGAAACSSVRPRSGGRLELAWGGDARLRVSPLRGAAAAPLPDAGAASPSAADADGAVPLPPSPHDAWAKGLSDGFVLEFRVRSRDGVAASRCCAEVVVDLSSGGEWFGGAHYMRPSWPLGGGACAVGPHFPFDNGPTGVNTLVGTHWVASSGALVLVDPSTRGFHSGLNAPPPDRNWLLGTPAALEWGCGVTNFMRPALPRGAGDGPPGDGLLRVQARASYASRRARHPLNGWVSPLPTDDDALDDDQAEGGGGGAGGGAEAGGEASSGSDNGNGNGNGNGGSGGSVSGEAWLTLRVVLCACSDVLAASRAALRTFAPPPSPPPPLLLGAPIWTTWARLKAGVRQADVERFADEIVARGLPRSVMEVDDRWQAHYGDLVFDAAKFPDPKGMVERLASAGFETTLWVMPFAAASSAAFAEGAALGYFVGAPAEAAPPPAAAAAASPPADHSHASLSLHGGHVKPGFFAWWNAAPVVALDVTNPDACDWFVSRLAALQASTGVAGFKFDAGEPCFLPHGQFVTRHPLATPGEYTALWLSRVASRFPVAEVRAGWGSQRLGLLTRMGDRSSSWGLDNGLASLIPTLLTSSLLGYPFCLPDMVGGNAYFGQFPSAELLARWAQCSALMPSMQLSIPPWDCGPGAEAAVEAALRVRAAHATVIAELAQRATVDLEPICRPVWWLAPTDPDALRIDDAFALGDDIIVAPVVARGAVKRDVFLPPGRWVDPRGGEHAGPGWVRDYDAPMDHLPVFTRRREA